MPWVRYGRTHGNPHAAHLFVDGKQQCKTRHGDRLAPSRRIDPTDAIPKAVDVTPLGLPFGRACAQCLKAWHRAQRRLAT